MTREKEHICPSKIFKLQIFGSENARFPLKILIDRQEEGTHRPSWNIQGAAFNKISPQYNGLGFPSFNNSFGRKHVLKGEHIYQAMKWDLAINHNNPWRTSTTCKALNKSIYFIGIKKDTFPSQLSMFHNFFSFIPWSYLGRSLSMVCFPTMWCVWSKPYLPCERKLKHICRCWSLHWFMRI